MPIIDIQEAQLRFTQIVNGMIPGEQLVITQNGQVIAELTRRLTEVRACKAGSAAHLPHWMADDFNEPLELVPASTIKPTPASPPT